MTLSHEVAPHAAQVKGLPSIIRRSFASYRPAGRAVFGGVRRWAWCSGCGRRGCRAGPGRKAGTRLSGMARHGIVLHEKTGRRGGVDGGVDEGRAAVARFDMGFAAARVVR